MERTPGVEVCREMDMRTSGVEEVREDQSDRVLGRVARGLDALAQAQPEPTYESARNYLGGHLKSFSETTGESMAALVVFLVLLSRWVLVCPWVFVACCFVSFFRATVIWNIKLSKVLAYIISHFNNCRELGTNPTQGADEPLTGEQLQLFPIWVAFCLNILSLMARILLHTPLPICLLQMLSLIHI